MELGIVSIVLIVLIVWYFGKSINGVVKGSGELAESEFSNFKREQDLRIRKAKISQSKALNEVIQETFYSDDEWDKLIKASSKGE